MDADIDYLALIEKRAAQARFHRRMLERMPAEIEHDDAMTRFESNLEVSKIKEQQAKMPLPEHLRPRNIQLEGGAIMRYDPQRGDKLPPYPDRYFPTEMSFVVGNAEDANSIRNYISGKRTRIGEFLFGNR